MLEYKMYENKDNRHLKLNMRNLIVYLLIYAITWAVYIFVCSYAFLVLLVFMTIVPFISLCMEHCLLKRLVFKLSISDIYVHRGDTVHVGLLLDNPSYFNAVDVNVDLEVGNIFYKTGAPIRASVPVAFMTVNKAVVPFIAKLNGIISVKVNKIEVRDLMGIVSYIYDVNMTSEVKVLPENVYTDDLDKTGLYEGVAENEETNSKGNDLSDVSNIREYIPGDRIKDIHWKISAKRDKLMVKERVRISERQLIMLVDICGENQDIDSALQYAYNVVRMCLTDGIPSKLVWWNNKARKLEDHQVMSFEDLKEAYVSMYQCGIGKDSKEAMTQMKMLYSNIASYIHICAENGTVKGVPVENV